MTDALGTGLPGRIDHNLFRILTKFAFSFNVHAALMLMFLLYIEDYCLENAAAVMQEMRP